MGLKLNASNDVTVGEQLKIRRKQLGMTLKEVADGAGLSVGFISQVERGLTAPSLSSLAGISDVLGVHMSRFLSVPSSAKELTRETERAVYSVSAGAISYERISGVFPGSVLNSVLVHEPPGSRSIPIRHEGEELFFVLAGSLTVELDGECTILNSGDSIHFDSTRQHSSWNHTTEPTTILHVCTMNVFGSELDTMEVPGNQAGHKHTTSGA